MTVISSAGNPAEGETGSGLLTSEEVESQPAQPVALRQLVTDHLDFVWRSLRRVGVPTADVDDAAQQVFLIVNDKLARSNRSSERFFLSESRRASPLTPTRLQSPRSRPTETLGKPSRSAWTPSS